MKLIIYDNYEITIADELLLVKPFRKMLLQDRSTSKERFIEKISYIFFMYDPRSNYGYIIDLEERALEIIKQEGLQKNFKPDALMLEAIEIYKRLVVTSAALILQGMTIALEKIRLFLNTVKLDAIDDRGKPIYTINSITSAVKQLPELSAAVQKAEKALLVDIDAGNKMRGQAEKKICEDGY